MRHFTAKGRSYSEEETKIIAEHFTGKESTLANCREFLDALNWDDRTAKSVQDRVRFLRNKQLLQ